MELFYRSTRDEKKKLTASEAILQGLSDEGGLFVPERIPALDVTLSELSQMDYQETAYTVMKQYFTDFTEEELRSCIRLAYDGKFDTETIVPLANVDGVYYLELFHGPTIAFKDMALSILPYLLTTAAKKHQVTEEIVILTATSGDTGKAALAGFANVEGTRIIVFYPKDGVSEVQKLQMITQTGENTDVIAIHGNFDEAQSGVKSIFENDALKAELKKAGFRFSSANSINIGRLVPQIVYYVYTYGVLLKNGEICEGEPINVTVPTGNFGNILAAYFAKKMGIPIAKLICASNDNKVLFDFFRTGTYDKNRVFVLTESPSMDILISSNLERLIYLISGREENRKLMEELKEEGCYSITEEMKDRLSDFASGYASAEEMKRAIRDTYENTGYVMDPHTAVASAVYGAYQKECKDQTKTVIASTASPYKFAGSVLRAIDPEQFENSEGIGLTDVLSKLTGTEIPKAVEEIRNAEIRHTKECEVCEMENLVREILGLR